MQNIAQKIFQARQGFAKSNIVRETILEKSLFLSSAEQQVYFKCEHLQATGSFKLRGATNKLLQLQQKNENFEVITASTGNHGFAVAYAAMKQQIKAQVFVPNSVDASKAHNIKSCGAVLNDTFEKSLDAELAARKLDNGKDVFYISPYNDWDVMIGQGTIGVEIVEQLQGTLCDEVYVAVGGGGLIGGIASYIKSVQPNCKIIGCQPQLSNVMFQSVKAGHILQNVPEWDTFSDGTAGGIEDDTVTFDACASLVDEWRMVTEDEIKKAFQFLMAKEHYLVEGSAAVTLAAFWQKPTSAKTIVLVLCGKNVSLEKVKQMLQ